jgi:hypothetical protein
VRIPINPYQWNLQQTAKERVAGAQLTWRAANAAGMGRHMTGAKKKAASDSGREKRCGL